MTALLSQAVQRALVQHDADWTPAARRVQLLPIVVSATTKVEFASSIMPGDGGERRPIVRLRRNRRGADDPSRALILSELGVSCNRVAPALGSRRGGCTCA
jgi:hypothetical protein